ncbi:odorant-binding protein 2b isoform X3 [Pan paniscus]|uniref:odorant-binding protein 2b isoform X3 n=1 Tax=Pan paniscus TaxID=9597 RepID=UPI00155F8D9E|nr:odorant-binding protein 2b isoform X3 [Pan paniscus]
MQDWLPPWGGVHRATCSQDTGQGAIKNISRGASTALFRRPVTCRGRQHRALEMKTLFLGVTLGLAAALSFTLEEEDITGTWYVKAMVVDKDFPEDRRPRKVSPVKVTALGSGNLEATFTFMREDRCIQKKILMRKTEEPGKFSAFKVDQITPALWEALAIDTLRKLRIGTRRPRIRWGQEAHVPAGAAREGPLRLLLQRPAPWGPAPHGKACGAVPLSPPWLTWPPHLHVGILIPTGRPWKNLRNWCSARHSRRRTFSRPCRREAGFSNTRQPPGSAPPEPTLPPDTEPGPPGPTLQP